MTPVLLGSRRRDPGVRGCASSSVGEAATPPLPASGPCRSRPTTEPIGAPGLVITTKPLAGIPSIRNFFRTNETPIYFVSATAFNLLGIDRWVRNFRFVNYYDSFDGAHPNVFVPKEQTPRAFESIEEICNYLLGHKEVVDLVDAPRAAGKAAFLMFDEETEELAARARARGRVPVGGAPPPDGLEDRDDAAGQRGRRAERARTRWVAATTYRGAARARATAPGSATDLVVQTPVRRLRARPRSSSRARTTGSETRRRSSASDLKVMKRIEPREAGDRGRDHPARDVGRAPDGRADRVPGADPVRRRLVRQRRVRPTLLTEKQRRMARERTIAMGERLRAEGYRGYFELDFLPTRTPVRCGWAS